MDLHLTITLASVAIVCLGLALLIAHPLVTRVLAVAGTVLGGVVLMANLVGS